MCLSLPWQEIHHLICAQAQAMLLSYVSHLGNVGSWQVGQPKQLAHKMTPPTEALKVGSKALVEQNTRSLVKNILNTKILREKFWELQNVQDPCSGKSVWNIKARPENM